MEQNYKAKNQSKSPDIGNGHIQQELETDNGDEKSSSFPQNKLEKKSRKRIRVRGKRSRPPKRARLLKKEPNEKCALNTEENNSSLEVEASSDDVEFCLDIKNLPSTWTFMDVKNFIDMQCGPVDEIEMIKDEDTNNCAIRLAYQTEAECKEAMKKLQNKDIDGRRLSISMIVVDLSDSEMQDDNHDANSSTDSPKIENKKPEEPEIIKPWRPDLDMWDIDPEGTYGLKESFLQSLDITPPIDKWVYVANFRCDKHELRDVLDMAGTVLQCSVFTTVFKYANVMYSHPLEAVQAVAILNGQTFYGHKLKVVMQRCPTNTVFLPKGLIEVGPGLGANGRPLRSIIKHYERYLNNQTATLNMDAFDINTDENRDLVTDEEKFEVKLVQDFKYQVPISETKVPLSNVKPDVPVPGTESPEPQPETEPEVVIKYVNTKAKLQGMPEVPKPKKKKVKSPADSPMIQPGAQNQSFPRKPGPNVGPKPMWSGPGPDPGLRQFGPRPIQGPRPMGPMQGPRPMGPMQGPRPVGQMPGPRPVGQMPGPRPMGPMQGPNQGPMGGPMAGHNHGSMGGPIAPMQGPIGGPMQQPIGAPMQVPMGGPMQASMGAPMQGYMGAQMQQPMGAQMQGPMSAPMQGPMGAQMLGQNHGPMQGQGPMMNQMQYPMGPGSNVNEPVQMQLSNLPPSTTFALLCEKMAACGQVVSIQLTTPGAAVVTFSNRMQADNCYSPHSIEAETRTAERRCVFNIQYERDEMTTSVNKAILLAFENTSPLRSSSLRFSGVRLRLPVHCSAEGSLSVVKIYQ